ncbi:hypothetical protein [Variovorax sp. RO1]|uniref:hypothetical protein n=1 Tax=Variovorax sp. RO1 TaxID=2066034 RepID=UPI00117FB2ED|nr:hypothetical protein [Variovorax sp. RO1]
MSAMWHGLSEGRVKALGDQRRGLLCGSLYREGLESSRRGADNQERGLRLAVSEAIKVFFKFLSAWLAGLEICHILVGFAAEYLWFSKRLVLSGVLVVGGEESLRKLTRFEKTVHNRRLRWKQLQRLELKGSGCRKEEVESEKSLRKLTRFEKTVHNRRLR